MDLKTTPVANWTNLQWKHFRSACNNEEQTEIMDAQELAEGDMVHHYLSWKNRVDPAWLRPGPPPVDSQ